MKYRILALILLFCALSLTAHATNWLNYTNGNQITCMAEEGNFMWIGTSGGLVKLNKSTGVSVYYNKGNSGLTDNYITCIDIDSQGNKWIGTYMRLCRFNGSTWNSYHPDGESIYFYVRNIAIDAQDNVWVSGSGTHLYKFNGSGQWIDINDMYTFLPLSYLNCLEFDSHNNLFIGTNEWLLKFDGMSWTITTNLADLIQDYAFFITDIVVDNQDNVWLGSFASGLIKYDGVNWTPYNTENSLLPDNSVESMVCDAQNNLWVGSYSGKLSMFDGNVWTHVNSASPQPFTKSIDVLFSDSQNTLWVGTQGLYKQTGATWTKVNTSNSGLPSQTIIDIHKDSLNRMWFITDNGLTKLDNGVWTVYDTTDISIPSNNFYHIDSESDEDIWFHNFSKVINFDGVNWIIHDSANSILPGSIYSLGVDNQNSVWVGSANGTVYKYNGTTWTALQIPLTTTAYVNAISQIKIDYNNKIYCFGYFGFGIYDGSTWSVHYYSEAFFPIGEVFSYSIDADNKVWLGTKECLAIFDGENWSYLNPDNSSFPLRSFSAIAFDNQNNLWLRNFDYNGGSYVVKHAAIGNTWFDTLNSDLISTEITCIAVDNQNNIWLGSYSGVSVYNANGFVATEDETQAPEAVSLIKAYPNPARHNDSITFEASKATTKGQLCIYNLKGQKVKSYNLTPGVSTITWDKTDEHNRTVAPGVYLYKFTAGNRTITQKIVLLR